ncbi:hypothetical protein [Paludibaculum fermentans]|uniref:Uncharacterized protein n=1 Tax=Paludibaculum fermentans TaxID=1473598 RepID=A0A7S7NNX2_PALFE|nr:hypothetical protein [Paludibaculum fermentans]QOY87015.1 hypothetical protein IRI77_30245 [Paludibaculum fermentans]
MRGLVIVLLAAACLGGCRRNAGEQPKVILDAILMDGSGRPPVSSSVVVVQDGVVKAFGDRAQTPIPPDGVEFHVPGKFIFPSDPAAPLRVGGPANLLIVKVNPASDPDYAKKTSGRMTNGHWDQYPQ